jgi:hypothetical protein
MAFWVNFQRWPIALLNNLHEHRRGELNGDAMELHLPRGLLTVSEGLYFAYAVEPARRALGDLATEGARFLK